MNDNHEGPECQQPYTMKSNTMEVGTPKPNYTLIFHNEDNMQIGRFDFNGDGLEFEGNATESAIVFINWIAEAFKGRLKDERNKVREECIKILEDAPEPDGADCAEHIRKEIE